MASRPYRARAVVLRKTKLREKDLIVTFLDESGALRQAVAKGARKPGGSFAARLELFSVVDGWFVEGKSLDIVTDAKLSGGSATRSYGIEQAACASAIAEMLCTVAQEGLVHERLFEMTVKSLAAIAHSDGRTALALCAATLLKILAMEGIRPSLDACVSCGREVTWPQPSRSVRLSIADGGIICPNCSNVPDAVVYDANVVAWIRALLGSTFEKIEGSPCDSAVSFEVLQFVKTWTRAHVGKQLKSIEFIFTGGLFD